MSMEPGVSILTVRNQLFDASPFASWTNLWVDGRYNVPSWRVGVLLLRLQERSYGRPWRIMDRDYPLVVDVNGRLFFAHSYTRIERLP